MFEMYLKAEHKKAKDYERISGLSFMEFALEKVYLETKNNEKTEKKIEFLMMMLAFFFGLLFMMAIGNAFFTLGKELFSLKWIITIMACSLPWALILLKWIFFRREDADILAEKRIIESADSLSELYISTLFETSLIKDIYLLNMDSFSIGELNEKTAFIIKRKLIKNAIKGQKVAKTFLKDIVTVGTTGVKRYKDIDLNDSLKNTINTKYLRFVGNKNIIW